MTEYEIPEARSEHRIDLSVYRLDLIIMPLLFLGFFCLRKFTTSRTIPPKLTTNVNPFRRLTIPELGKPLCFNCDQYQSFNSS
jgi:hypothetical protein